MKARYRRQRAANHKAARSPDQVDSPRAARNKTRAPKAKNVGKVHGPKPAIRADRKPRRREAREFGGGLPPASNDNLDFATQLANSVKNWRAGNYPAWRKDIANKNTPPSPGDKE